MPSVVTLTLNTALDLSTETQSIDAFEKLRCGPLVHDAGGGGVNVARVVHQLGGDTLAVLTAGGPPGDFVLRQLSREGVPHRAVRIAGDTRESFAVFETRTQRQFRFVLPGPALEEWEWKASLAALAGLDPAYVVASGSLPSGVPDDFYARLLRQVRDTGARFIHDTSGAPLALALDVGVYLVKPNRHEFAELTGADPENVADLERAAQDLVRRGRAEIVALTLGAQGALMVARTAVQRIAPPQVRAIGTIGAGDSFLGAMTFALARNWPHGESFRLAVAAGTAALTMPGTKLCQRDDVMAFYRDLGGTFARLDRP